MKGVPIKFRGKDILNGNVLYGDLLHAKNELLILEFGTKVARTVAKNSVAQLVGYDAEGKEVYEGDTLIRNPIEQSPIPLHFALRYLGEPEKIKTIAKMHPSIECKFYTLERGDLNGT